MKKIIKAILILVGVIIVLIVAGIAVLYVYFSKPERYKPLIEKVVYDATSRTLHLNGAVKFTIYPYIGFHIGNTTLANPSGFKETNMLIFESADLSISLMPLLKGSVIINKLSFNGLMINLVKKTATINNWTFTPTEQFIALESSASQVTTTSKTQDVVATKDRQDSSSKDSSYIAKAQDSKDKPVAQGTVAINNNSDSSPKAKVQNQDRPLILELKSLILNNATINYDDLTTKSHKGLSDFSLKIDTSYGGIIKVDVNEQQVILDKTNINFNDIVTGKINLNLDSFTSPVYKGDIDLPEFSLNTLLTKLKLNLAKPKPLFNKFSIQTKFAGDMTQAKLEITKFDFTKLLAGNITANLQNFTTKPSYTGHINITSSSLHSLLVASDLAMPRTKSKKAPADSFSLDSDFNGSSTKVNLKVKRFNYANNINATADLALLSMDPLSYKGSINLAPFSLNSLMINLGMEPIALPNKAILEKVSLQASLSGNKNRASLNSLILHIADSTLKGKADISSFSPLTVNEALTLDHAQVSDFVDIRGYMLPIKAVDLTGNIKLDSNKDIPASVSGKQVLAIHNATLKGFSVDLFIVQVDSHIQDSLDAIHKGGSTKDKLNSLGQVAKAIGEMKATINNQIAPGKKDLNKQTDLGTVNVNLNITKGLINPSSFSVHGPSLAVDGTGLVNLNNRTIDYKVHTKLVTKQKNDVLNSITFPYQIKGKFDNTSGSTDWNSIQSQLANYYINIYKKQLEDKVRKAIKTEANKQIDNLKNTLKNNAGKYLKGLF